MPIKTAAKYQREWRRRNPEKARAHSRKWNEKAGPEYWSEYRRANSEKINSINRRYRGRNPERVAAWRLRARAITPLRPMPECCEVCKKPPLGRWKKLHLDHDHETGEFRGWLCNSCNLGLGLIGDTLEYAEALVRYLKKEKDCG